LRGYFHSIGDDAESVDEEGHERLHSLLLDAGAAAVGRTLGDLDLESIGVEVTAVRRRGIRGSDPSPEMRIEAGDVLVLRGIPEALELAEQRLLQQ
jgi:CPA2 family monovalent cation:H+ antiporter-2